MTRYWFLFIALGLALGYEGFAAISGHWKTISQLVWTLEAQHPAYAVVLVVGFVILFVHFFVRKWK